MGDRKQRIVKIAGLQGLAVGGLDHDGGVAELGVGASGIDNAGGGQCCGDGRAEDDQRDLLGMTSGTF